MFVDEDAESVKELKDTIFRMLLLSRHKPSSPSFKLETIIVC
jgi:hypothetical protein